MRIAVIPARGGSKRIPRKNIKEFCGRPVIAWPIDTAKASGLFDHIIVSTDDVEIAEVATSFGAEVPFLRPPELSDDHADTAAVVRHTVQWALAQGWELDLVCCIYPTAVFINSSDLLNGLGAIQSGSWDYAFSVSQFSAPIFRAFQKAPNGGVEMFCPDNFAKRSQDFPLALHDAGQYYWGRAQAWTESRMVFSSFAKPVEISHRRVFDIDTLEDWLWAEQLFKFLSAQDGSQ